MHSNLIRHHHSNPDTLVLDELGLRHGRSRVDIAVINGQIHGYEIKSDLDNLVRLPRQVEVYGLTLDRVTIVVGNHLHGRIENLVPDWWGIIRCEQGPRGGVKFHTLQQAKRNYNSDPESVAMLLWRSEAVELLLSLGCEGSILREPRRNLCAELARRSSISDLSKAVRTIMKARQNWRCRPLPS